jgi:hypothetical protein
MEAAKAQNWAVKPQEKKYLERSTSYEALHYAVSSSLLSL